MTIWRDETSYSRGRRGVDEPGVWTLGSYPHEITVHRHIDCPGSWLVTCPSVGVDKARLLALDIETARLEALHMVEDQLGELRSVMEPLIEKGLGHS